MSRLVVCLVLLGLTGCKSSVKGDANFGASIAEEPPPESDASRATLPPPAPGTANEKTTFIGVTHALTLADDAAKNAKCTCLAAAVGRPGDPFFRWSGPVPEVGDGAIVFALASEQAPCERRAPGENRASIQAVSRRGDDIVIELEQAREGIPVAHGAVLELPRQPGSGSSIYLVPPRHAPFGHPLPGSNESECRIKLP